MQFRKNLLAASVAILAASHAQAVLITANMGENIPIFHAPTGKTLSLKHVSTKSQFRYSTAGLTFLPNGTVDSESSVLHYLNVLDLKPTGSHKATVLETYGEDIFYEPFRIGITVTSPGNWITIDTNTTSVKAVGGYDMGTLTNLQRVPHFANGGTFTIKNASISLAERIVTADLIGRSTPIGTRPAMDYAANTAPVWTYDSVEGPSAIPVAALLSAKDPTAALKSAGYLIWSSSAERVTFNAVYKFKNVRMTQNGKDFWFQSFSTYPSGVSGLNSLNQLPQGIGDVVVSVLLSAPRQK